MIGPSKDQLFAVCDATWPAARQWVDGPWTLRDGKGGGQRVSAATTDSPVTEADIDHAEDRMRAVGQNPLFQIRPGNEALDQMLDTRGYRIIDPVSLMSAPTEPLAQKDLPPVSCFTIWPPLAVMEDLWEEGGIDAPRLAVMTRAADPKTGLLGRNRDRPAGTGYGAIHDGIAMFHAIEVSPDHRRQKVALHMMICGARWARDHDASHVSVLCTKANTGARAFYKTLGFADVGQYHYRGQ